MKIEEPTTLLPNAADLDEIEGLEVMRLPVDQTAAVVGYFGAFEYFVDMDMVLDTAARLPDVAFWLVGGGRDLARIKERVAKERRKNVYLPGPVDHKTGLAMMAATDICLLPRRSGAFSQAACPSSSLGCHPEEANRVHPHGRGEEDRRRICLFCAGPSRNGKDHFIFDKSSRVSEIKDPVRS